MLVFAEQSLAFIAVPKTGTTAIEMALKHRADIVFTKRFKHMPASRFHARVAPFLDGAFGLRPDRVAVMREPEEQIRSWYRYRCRSERRGSEFSTHGVSFDAFVRAVISQTPPPYAGIGSQYRMLTSGEGRLLVHHLFAYEKPLQFRAFLDDRFGEEIVLKQRNVSPPADAPLDPNTRALLRAARAEEFDLYDRLTAAGGHLRTKID
ncbi:MAG: hypothetical protein ACK5MY_03595 [Jhaorihella sp.]